MKWNNRFSSESAPTEEYARRRPLILVNGLAEQPESWYRNVVAWRAHFDVHTPALLAYEGSALQRRIAARQPVDVDYLVEQLHLYIDSFVQSSPCFLLANSMGGKIAVEFSIRYPELIERLALLSPSGLERKNRLPLVDGVRRSDVRSLAESVFFDSSHVDPSQLAYFQRQFRNKRWRSGLLWTIRGTRDHNVRQRLSLITQPTLVVVGEEDRIVDPRESLEATRQLADGQVVRLAGCGHAPQIEKSEVVNQLVIDFFTEPAALSTCPARG